MTRRDETRQAAGYVKVLTERQKQASVERGRGRRVERHLHLGSHSPLATRTGERDSRGREKFKGDEKDRDAEKYLTFRARDFSGSRFAGLGFRGFNLY